MQREESAMSFFYHSVDYSPILYVKFLCASLEAFISVLKWPVVLSLKSCCVYEGGDDTDADDVGEVLYSWLRVMIGKEAI